MLAAGFLAASGTGCRTAQDSLTQRAPVRVAPKIIDPLSSPRFYKKDYVHPRPFVRQALKWNHKGCEWWIQVPVIPGASAGVVFRKAYDLSDGDDPRWLTLEMKPAFMAEHLSVVLTDGMDEPVRLYPAQPLSAYQVKARGDWGYYLVPFQAFEEAALAGLAAGDVFSHPAVDWSRIRGVEMVRLADQGPETLVMVRRLRFQQDALDIPHI
jgi:hypothetical protein